MSLADDLRKVQELEVKGKLDDARKKRETIARALKITPGQPLVVRKYGKPQDYEAEALILMALGYDIIGQTGDAKNTNVTYRLKVSPPFPAAPGSAHTPPVVRPKATVLPRIEKEQTTKNFAADAMPLASIPLSQDIASATPASPKAGASAKNTAIGCVAILVILGVIGAISGGGSKQVQTVGTNPSATVAPAVATSNATATAPQLPVVVANTDKQGVFIRHSPSAEDKIKVWPDGTVMQPVGPDQQTDGMTWRNVQDPEGNQGWVPAEYLTLPTPTPAPSATPDRSRYQLELLAVSGTWQYGYATVEGQVKNISGKSLQNVTAVVEWDTVDGQFITSDTALIEYNPVLAGQSSPFKVISTHNPAMSKYRTSFKSLLGGQIATLDSRAR